MESKAPWETQHHMLWAWTALRSEYSLGVFLPGRCSATPVRKPLSLQFWMALTGICGPSKAMMRKDNQLRVISSGLILSPLRQETIKLTKACAKWQGKKDHSQIQPGNHRRDVFFYPVLGRQGAGHRKRYRAVNASLATPFCGLSVASSVKVQDVI